MPNWSRRNVFSLLHPFYRRLDSRQFQVPFFNYPRSILDDLSSRQNSGTNQSLHDRVADLEFLGGSLQRQCTKLAVAQFDTVRVPKADDARQPPAIALAGRVPQSV